MSIVQLTVQRMANERHASEAEKESWASKRPRFVEIKPRMHPDQMKVIQEQCGDRSKDVK
jgi:hypothetical protein